MIQDQLRGLGSGFDDSPERTPLCVDEALLDGIVDWLLGCRSRG